MKRYFLLVALVIVFLFAYTFTLAQYISLSFLLDLLPHNIAVYFLKIGRAHV